MVIDVTVTEDYINLHGELIAKKGAKGVVRSFDRGYRGIDFEGSEVYTAVDGCGRHFHFIPCHNLHEDYQE